MLRLFPRKTRATPTDPLALSGASCLKLPKIVPEVDEIHVSVTFTWDLPLAEQIGKVWKPVAPVIFGGPATGDTGGDFFPGRYLAPGYVITSRGCPNRCWFCDVWRREGATRELPITEGHDLLDPNLLACSPGHIEKVFTMLGRQKERPRFTGGLEAKRLTPEIARRLKQIRPETLYCAYDTPDDLDPLIQAGKNLLSAGFTRASHKLRCYVLCGWKNDTFDKAEKRMREAWAAGFFPMAMAFRDATGEVPIEWKRFQRVWARPMITSQKLKEKLDD